MTVRPALLTAIIEVAADLTEDQKLRYLDSLTAVTVDVLRVGPDRIQITSTAPEMQARNERQAAIAHASWTGC